MYNLPVRSHYLFVCNNRRPDGSSKGSCGARGSEEIVSTLKEQIFQKGLAKTLVRVCSSSCLDACSSGPSILVEPDGYLYGHVNLGDIPEIVDSLAEGKRVERLVVESRS